MLSSGFAGWFARPASLFWPVCLAFILSISAAFAPAQAAARYASIAVDANTGKTLSAYRADARRYPASLTKVMTLYLLFRELKAKRITLNTRLKVSHHAASRQPSKLGLKPGQTIRVKHAILALITKSANDVAATIAEALGGSEQAFARKMTETARELGMGHTVFKNASGLPHSAQRTTARDMAKLGIRIQQDFPKYYRYFRRTSFTYRGKRYRNHNRLLGRYRGTDGIKTGYTRASGYNLLSSVKRGKKHVIAVVLGGRTGRDRNIRMMRLVTKAMPKAVAYKKRTRKTRVAVPVKPVPLPQIKPAKASSTQKTLARKALDKRLAALTPADRAANPAGRSPRDTITEADRYAMVKHMPKATASSPSIFASAVPVEPGALAGLRPSVVQNDPKPADEQSAKEIASAVKRDNEIRAHAAKHNPPKAVPVMVTRRDGQPTMTIVPTAAANPKPGALSNTTTGKIARAPGNDLKPTVIDQPDLPDGWMIQVGAYASKNLAERRLKQVRGKAKRHLSGKVAVALVHQSDEKTIYRARFAGFSRNAAARTCRRLKRRSVSCLALAPEGDR